MDYDYAQERIQFEENNVVTFNGVEEEEEEAVAEGEEEGDDYYDDDHQNNQNLNRTQNQHRRKQPLIHNQNSSSDSSQGKLFVGGISWETTEETFTSYFRKFGEIVDSVIMRDRHSGRPRGFGFVTFVDPAAADWALEEEHVIDGRVVEVKRTVPREEMEVKGVIRAKKIFVGGLPATLTEDELKEYFSVYGNIVEHQIMLDHKTGRSRGFGFVTFETEDSVERIFSEDRTHELGGKRVEIKKAVPKRNGGDYGSTAKSHMGFGNGAGYGVSHSPEDMYGSGKLGGGYGGYCGYGGYSGFGGYGGINGFYGGYGGYGYGFSFGGPVMFGGGGYGGSGYGASSVYGHAAGYGSGKGYGRSSDRGRGYGSSSAVNSGDGNSRGYGGSENGGYGSSSKGYRGNENGGHGRMSRVYRDGDNGGHGSSNSGYRGGDNGDHGSSRVYGGSENGGHDSNNGRVYGGSENGGGSAVTGRYHPYQK